MLGDLQKGRHMICNKNILGALYSLLNIMKNATSYKVLENVEIKGNEAADKVAKKKLQISLHQPITQPSGC